ncbi:MAG: Cys-tRNA(Pro) deacylase [Pseudoalteromonas spongiae]|uniref:Cys-tRNA(Pro)/Cys-tRNA(Cys) deacylase n=1 Tax=Pseudoalteromonas spongiae TaxID=298657 RepID=A0ABU8EV69_9GAMM|nr:MULTISPECIES: Cys-tRNA(Pro) deacylase [Pseudoalteromonas]ATD01085.1 putative transcription regulator [Pseudoalteromonas spongiae UST010723-006]TMO82845.1 Cys-tRNA(Pro) deacylase [Pseudoalteromonas spongiae]
MTPAIKTAEKAKIDFSVHQYEHDSSVASFGLEASEKLGVSAATVFKTLVASLDNGELVVAIIPVDRKLNLKAVAKASKAKKAKMAEPLDVERSTGYVLGGVSPLGQKKRLKTLLDDSAKAQSTIYVSAGRRGLEIELQPSDLLSLTNGQFVPLKAE